MTTTVLGKPIGLFPVAEEVPKRIENNPFFKERVQKGVLKLLSPIKAIKAYHTKRQALVPKSDGKNQVYESLPRAFGFGFALSSFLPRASLKEQPENGEQQRGRAWWSPFEQRVGLMFDDFCSWICLRNLEKIKTNHQKVL